jgi:hypothetical protein
MSLLVLPSGALIGDPQRGENKKGLFTIATICANGDAPLRAARFAFGDEAGWLLEFAESNPLAVSGRARLSAWMGPTVSRSTACPLSSTKSPPPNRSGESLPRKPVEPRPVAGYSKGENPKTTALRCPAIRSMTSGRPRNR